LQIMEYILKNKLAFTLVELIVVITILAILWTIAFISLEGYSRQARDATRISDMSKIKTSIELFWIEAWVFPETTDWVLVEYNTLWLNIWEQWLFWEVSFRSVDMLDKIPLDPLIEKRYIYSVTTNRKEYQIWWILETENLVMHDRNQVNADWWEVNLRVIWNYNQSIMKVVNWNQVSILAVPSIITLCWTTVEDIITNNYFLYDGYAKFPKDYNWINLYTQCDWNWELLVNSWSYELFSWNISDLIWEENKQARIDLVSNIQSAYIWTKTESNWWLDAILSINTSSNPDAADLLWQWIVLSNLKKWISSLSSIEIVWWDSSSASNPFQWCAELWAIFDAATTYEWCDTPDIVVCWWEWIWNVVAACNVWTNTAWAIGGYFNFGLNDTSKINWAESMQRDWLSPGWTNAWSANNWWVEEAEKDSATYANQSFEDKVKMQWPCVDWYHIPTIKEWFDLVAIGQWGNNWTQFSSDLKLAKSGKRSYWPWQGTSWVNDHWIYWSSSTSAYSAYSIGFWNPNNTYIQKNTNFRSQGNNIRCFKN